MLSRTGASLTVSLTQAQAAILEDLAAEHGYTWGKYGNISALMRSLADGDLVISRPLDSSFEGDVDPRNTRYCRGNRIYVGDEIYGEKR